MTLGEVAVQLGAELRPGEDSEADAASLAVTGVAGIETAGPAEITFIDNPKYANFARTTKAAAVIVSPDFAAAAVATLRIRNPYLAFARAISLFYRPPAYAPGIHPTAVVAPTARLGHRAHVSAYVVIAEGCTVGDDAVLLPHVVLYPGVTVGHRFLAHAHAVVRENCRLGDDVVLQNGAVVGADGFGFAKDTDGRWTKILQSGPAVLEDAVEVQANACGDGAVATAQTGIPSDVAPGAVVSGYPAMDNRAWLRTVAAVNRLPELFRRMRAKSAAQPDADG